MKIPVIRTIAYLIAGSAVFGAGMLMSSVANLERMAAEQHISVADLVEQLREKRAASASGALSPQDRLERRNGERA